MIQPNLSRGILPGGQGGDILWLNHRFNLLGWGHQVDHHDFHYQCALMDLLECKGNLWASSTGSTTMDGLQLVGYPPSDVGEVPAHTIRGDPTTVNSTGFTTMGLLPTLGDNYYLLLVDHQPLWILTEMENLLGLYSQ